MSVRAMALLPMATRDSRAHAVADTSPNSFAYAPPSNAAAFRARTAPNGAREKAFGHLLNRLEETARFTAAAEAEATEALLEAILGEAAAPNREQIDAWTPSLEAVLRTLCENSGRFVRLQGLDAKEVIRHGFAVLQEVQTATASLGRLRRLAHAVSVILDLAGDAP
ncbi:MULTISPECIES: hypothetical protein [Streptomyces]|uniref:hypothetical protein n=1 Tax=Streptomyces TaxID=1883 RepID=UPI0004BED189|nr:MULTISPECIES: hypothetical protein [Streptomyces]MDX3275240.1 hypothetical protein [Streptomyces scabiei]MDX3846995.1 hypothetical protein [Streptomyces europaeiscabiei]